jgi:hypothetical protein
MGRGPVLSLHKHTLEDIYPHYGLWGCNTMDTKFAKVHAECSGTPSMSEKLMKLNHISAYKSYKRHTLHYNKIYDHIAEEICGNYCKTLNRGVRNKEKRSNKEFKIQ